MRSGFLREPWRFVDRFGEEWQVAFPDPEEREPDAGAPSFDKRRVVEHLVFQAFASSGATDDAIARVLLRVYDAVTNRQLARQVPRPTEDPRRLLRGFEAEIREVLLFAFADDRVRIERAERAPWPFPDPPDASPLALDDAPVGEVTTWIGLALVDQNGKPVGGRRYQITFPDGSTTQGLLASDGTARVEGIGTPGTCQVDFLDFDKMDWGPQTLLPGGTMPGTTGPVAEADATPPSTSIPPSAPSPSVRPSSQPGNHVVTHTFVDATGSPVANIAWQLAASDGTTIASGVTDASGEVSVPVASEGDYSLTYDFHFEDAPPDSGNAIGIDLTEDYSSP